MTRVSWYEEWWVREKWGSDKESYGKDCGRSALLQERLYAAFDQVRGLEDCLCDLEEHHLYTTESVNDLQKKIHEEKT
jgi:hypothetical protein